MKTLIIKVAGVTFEGRQAKIARLTGFEPVQLVPEPTNQYDANAIAVHVATANEGIVHVGYVPRELAAELAELMQGESLVGSIEEITGGFESWSGRKSSYGLRVRVEVPDYDGKEYIRF